MKAFTFLELLDEHDLYKYFTSIKENDKNVLGCFFWVFSNLISNDGRFEFFHNKTFMKEFD